MAALFLFFDHLDEILFSVQKVERREDHFFDRALILKPPDTRSRRLIKGRPRRQYLRLLSFDLEHRRAF